MTHQAGDAAQLYVARDQAGLERLGTWVDGFAAAHDLSPRQVFALQLCLEEAVSNAVRHGAVPVQVRLRTGNGAVVAELEDQGEPFDPTQVAAPVRPASLEEAVPGGLGIHLMRQFCRDIVYARDGGTNRLRLTFPV